MDEEYNYDFDIKIRITSDTPLVEAIDWLEEVLSSINYDENLIERIYYSTGGDITRFNLYTIGGKYERYIR